MHRNLCFVKANDLIKDVFTNLIDNAIKHSYAEKPLVINVKLEQVKDKNKEFIRCAVEDNGPRYSGLGEKQDIHAIPAGCNKGPRQRPGLIPGQEPGEEL